MIPLEETFAPALHEGERARDALSEIVVYI